MLRTYWRNYYEQTDALLWVVDSADVERMQVGLALQWWAAVALPHQSRLGRSVGEWRSKK